VMSKLDRARIGLLIAGVLCVATGLLPWSAAEANLRRIGPLLLFLGGVIVLTSLARRAQVFDVIAVRLAIMARGNHVGLFLLCASFATVTTIVLNLDTTAVLLTPVFLALASSTDIEPLPLAMTTTWLANTASLLLPVSNLTNLLAADRIGSYVPVMWAPQVAAVVVTVVFLWVFYWRRGRYTPPAPVRVTGRALFWTLSTICAVFALTVPFVEPWQAAVVCAGLALLAFVVLDRSPLRWTLIPWRLLCLVTGLFLIVPTLMRLGLGQVMTAVVGTNALQTAAAGAVLANVLNNLPAYVAGESAAGHHLPALLIGTNVGSVITPWSSLATLLCLETCRAHRVKVPMVRFVLTGLALATVSVLTSTLALQI
jgi:arsenical pump membrane protein